MAVRDYKRALEVEPSNWMVKTRLSLAHYLKVRGWFENALGWLVALFGRFEDDRAAPSVILSSSTLFRPTPTADNCLKKLNRLP